MKRCKEHNWSTPIEFKLDDFIKRDKIVCKECGKTEYIKVSQEEKLKRAIKRYPNLAGLKHDSTQKKLKYAKALDKYPDLKDLAFLLVIKAYDFREEVLKGYQVDHTSALADARCDIQLGGGFRNVKLPKDLPAFEFENECAICWEYKKGISICPECWQLIRKALEIKGENHRKGWIGWGVEINLDLSPIVKLLKSDKEGQELLNQKIEYEKQNKGKYAGTL